MKLKNKFLMSIVATGMLFSVASANADSSGKHNSVNKSEYIQEKVNKAVKTEKQKIKNLEKKLSVDKDRRAALLALQNFAQALFDLKSQDKVAAKAKLQYAKKLLKNAKKEIIPIQVRMFFLEFEGTPQIAKELAMEFKQMVQKGNLQEASDVLNIMKDELDVLEIDVNKKNFEKNIKKIEELVKANKLKEALETAAKVFNNPMVFPKFMLKYPLGLIKAAFLVENAKAFDSMKQTDYRKIDTLIEEAIQELKLDKELGYFYGKEELYEKIIDELNKIKEKAKNNKTGDYSELSEVSKNLKTLKDKSQRVDNPKSFLIKK